MSTVPQRLSSPVVSWDLLDFTEFVKRIVCTRSTAKLRSRRCSDLPIRLVTTGVFVDTLESQRRNQPTIFLSILTERLKALFVSNPTSEGAENHGPQSTGQAPLIATEWNT